MKTTFALAMLAFASSTSALKLTEEVSDTASTINSDSCTSSITTDLRDTSDTTLVLFNNWTNAYNMFSSISDFAWPATDISYCNDLSMRSQNNQCLTWLAYSTDESTGAEAGALNWETCGHENATNQAFSKIGQYSVQDNLSNDQSAVVYRNDASQLCLTGDGLLSSDCSTGVMHRSKITQDNVGYLRNEGTEECLIPVANEQSARVTSAECENDPNQKWVVFGNSEIVHVATGLCLGTSSGKMGILSISSCTDIVEQGFKATTTAGRMQFTWMADNTKSLEAVSFEGQAVAPRATSSADVQFWQMVDNNEWNDALFTWVEVGCGNGVEMSHSYSEEFNVINTDGTKDRASDEFVLSAREELVGETDITNAPSVNAQYVDYLTETYSAMMNHPSDPTIDRSHMFTCSGENTCMYRSIMTMHNNYENEDLEWITGYTRCLTDLPVCPPLTVYDEESTTCIVSQ